MHPTFAELYSMAFSWDPDFEFLSVRHLLSIHRIQGPCLIADVGAGTGRFVECITRQGFFCLAIEPDPEMYKVLETTVAGLLESHRSKITLVHTCFEVFDVQQKFSALLAMTDTLSYVLPESRLSSFLSHAKDAIAIGGVLIIDVGLWKTIDGESRMEEWLSETQGWLTTARCSASMSQLQSNGRMARRLETLTFEAKRTGLTVERSQQREILCFSHKELVDFVSSYGFRFSEALEPGSIEPIDFQRGNVKRAFFCFVNEA